MLVVVHLLATSVAKGGIFLNSILHKLRYINWQKEAKIVNVKYEEFKNIYKGLDKEKRIRNTKTKRDCFDIGCWNYTVKNNYASIYVHSGINDYRVYICNVIDDNKNTGEKVNMHKESKGRKALKYVRDLFEGVYGTTLNKEFGTTPRDFVKCVPTQFYHNGNINRESGVIHNVSSIDFCSHYPSNMCGKLPNSNTMIELKGTIKPNEEYPFAFYLKSGHCAEYNVFDTHDWIYSEYAIDLFKPHPIYKELSKDLNVEKDDDITILMKASDYELTLIYEDCYDWRKKDENAKLVMNASIGQMHTKKYRNDKYAHLAAICIARANQKMLNILKEIPRHFIIQVCVDGVIYRGSKILGVNEKKLGNLEQEYVQKSILYVSMNKYIVCDFKQENKPYKWKYSGCNKTIDGIELNNDYTPLSIYDVDKWIKVEKLEELYEEEEV